MFDFDLSNTSDHCIVSTVKRSSLKMCLSLFSLMISILLIFCKVLMSGNGSFLLTHMRRYGSISENGIRSNCSPAFLLSLIRNPRSFPVGSFLISSSLFFLSRALHWYLVPCLRSLLMATLTVSSYRYGGR